MLNRIEIESHCIVTGVNRITSLAASYVSYRWLCIDMRIASASVMAMHIPTVDRQPAQLKKKSVCVCVCVLCVCVLCEYIPTQQILFVMQPGKSLINRSDHVKNCLVGFSDKSMDSTRKSLMYLLRVYLLVYLAPN